VLTSEGKWIKTSLCTEEEPRNSATRTPYLINRFITSILKAQVHHCVLQRPAHVEFQGKIVNALRKQRKNIRCPIPTPTLRRLGDKHTWST
jgi:hypothetical protein